jgi:signal transduction histidine kinase
MIKKIRFEYKITFLYILLGGLWIIFSDKLLDLMVHDPKRISDFQTYKGWVFVIVTSMLFFKILRSHLQKIRIAEAKAKESDNLKTAFLRNISHEIRTPMNSIMGFSTLLNENDISEKKKAEYLKIIKNSSNQLLNIVNEILDISMLETGNLTAIIKKVNLNDLIDDIYAFFLPLIKNEVKFSTSKFLDNSNSNIMSDESKLKKILSNLINNALKFTDKGHITFGYEVKNNELLFFVEDTGIGIPEDFVPYIFSNFSKSEKNISKFYSGLGLGLSISKGNVELLKGKIWADSSRDKGSRFNFTIPFRQAD